MYLQNIFVTTKPYEKNKNSVYKNMIKIPVLFFIYLNFIYCGSNPVHVSPLTMTVNVSERTSFLSKRQEVINSVIDANENTLTAIQKILNCNSLTDGSSNKELLENLKQQAKDTISKNLERIKTALEYFEETEGSNNSLVKEPFQKINVHLYKIAKYQINSILLHSKCLNDYNSEICEGPDKKLYRLRIKLARNIVNEDMLESENLIKILFKTIEIELNENAEVDEDIKKIVSDLSKQYGDDFIVERRKMDANVEDRSRKLETILWGIVQEFKTKLTIERSLDDMFDKIWGRLKFLFDYFSMIRMDFPERSDNDIKEFIKNEIQNIFVSLIKKLKKLENAADCQSIFENIENLQQESFICYKLQSSSLNLEFQNILKVFKFITDMRCEEWMKFINIRKQLTSLDREFSGGILYVINNMVSNCFIDTIQLTFECLKGDNEYLKRSDDIISYLFNQKSQTETDKNVFLNNRKSHESRKSLLCDDCKQNDSETKLAVEKGSPYNFFIASGTVLVLLGIGFFMLIRKK